MATQPVRSLNYVVLHLKRFGKRITTPLFMIRFQFCGKAAPQHFIQVPKRVVPLATRRNRIKRMTREALLKLEGIARVNDILIIYSADPGEVKTPDIAKFLKAAFAAPGETRT